MKQLRHFGIRIDNIGKSHELYLKSRHVGQGDFYQTHPEIDPKETILITQGEYPVSRGWTGSGYEIFDPESPKQVARLSQNLASMEIAAEVEKIAGRRYIPDSALPPLISTRRMASQVDPKITTKVHRLWNMSERGLKRRVK